MPGWIGQLRRLQRSADRLLQGGTFPPAATTTSTPSTMTKRITITTIATRIALMALTELKLWVDASILRLQTPRHPQSTMDHGDGFEADAAAARDADGFA